MSSPPPYPPDDHFQPLPPTGGAAGARDHGVRRTRRVTRWIAVAAVTGAAALGGLYTHLLPGSSASPAPAGPQSQHPATPSHATTAAHGDDGEGEGDDGGEGDDDGAQSAPQAPAQPPAATQQQPQATTGAS